MTRGPTVEVEGITEYRLENGLRVLLFPDPSRQRTTVNTTYFVGSRHEGYGETGMAHLLEHLVLKGTPRHPNIPQELTERGAQPNGTTWFDRTNYFETFPATEENLAWALDLEADRMVNSFIAGEDLESEMTVVRNEWEAGENSPFGVLLKRTLAAAFQWHNYGKSTIGARSDVENVPVGRLRAFYRKYFQPDNALLVVAGRFDEGRALELIAKTFGPIPRPDRSGEMKIWRTYTAEPPTEEEVERAKNELLKNMELAFRDTERIALQLSEWAAMGDWRLFFLHRDRVERVTAEDVALVARAYLLPSNRTLGLFLPADETPPRAEIPPPPDVEALVADYRGREEVEAAKRGWQQNRENLRGRDEVLANQLAGGLFFDRTMAWEAGLEARVMALEPAEIVEAMRRHIDPERLVVVRAGDFRRTGAGEGGGGP